MLVSKGTIHCTALLLAVFSQLLSQIQVIYNNGLYLCRQHIQMRQQDPIPLCYSYSKHEVHFNTKIVPEVQFCTNKIDLEHTAKKFP